MFDKINLQWHLFFKEFALFGLTLAIGIFLAHKHSGLIKTIAIEPMSYSWGDIIVLFVFLILVSFLLPKFKRLSFILFNFFLLLVVFSGSQAFFGVFIPSPWYLLAAVALTAIFVIFRSVLIHNLGIIFGIAGIASLLGLMIVPEAAIALLIILSFYDILAVYWTRHMVALAKGMMESGAIFGFIIPFRWGDLFYRKTEARQKIGERFMILGSGDVGLPLVLVSSIAVHSIGQAVLVGLFSCLGLLATHLLFVNQAGRRPMAALPPIATLTIIGYLLTLA